MSKPTVPKPAPFPVRPENIPCEMKARAQWVVWRWTWKTATKKRAGKWDKPPINARTGRAASSTDPETWSSFEVVFAAYRDSKNGYDGVGYVFSGDEGDFVGIDLDKCRDPISGELRLWSDEQRACKHWDKTAPEPAKIIELLSTYTEVSPSQSGVKLIARGTIPKGLKHGSVEMYRVGRYFTVTGQRLPGSAFQVGDCAALGEVYRQFNAQGASTPRHQPTSQIRGQADPRPPSATVRPTLDQVLAGCNNAANGAKFCRLFGGDTKGYPSQSEAELALCGIAAFWSAGDASLIDQIYRQSKLFRGKWDEGRGGQTYGQRTIAVALDGCTQFFDWSCQDAHDATKKETPRSAGGGIVKRLADRIAKGNRFAQDAGTKLYRYYKGVYRLRGEEFVRRRVKQLLIDWKLTKLWSPALADAVVEYVRVDAPLLWEKPPADVINVQNGLLNVCTREFFPHTPNQLTSVQLPVIFDPSATCPAIEEFVHQVFPADAIDLAWEIPAYLMTPDTSIQKAILLTGAGGNGKSTWLTLLIAFLGKSNTSGVSLHKLEADRFAASRLCGKLANICPDLPSEHLIGTSVFKAITGGDVVTGEYKFKDSFDFVPFSRLLFSANSPPLSKDSSQGFFDRWMVIPFERSFRGTTAEVPRSMLDARLASTRELSGLLNKALDALVQVRAQHGFTQPASVRKAWQEFHAATDPLAVWLDTHTVETPNAIVVRKDLRAAFNGHLADQSRPPMPESAFGTAFEKLRPHIQSKQRTVSGKVQWCYVGLGLRSPHMASSHLSQGSQGYPYINQSREKEVRSRTEKGEDSGLEQDRANPVNPVNAVNRHVSPGGSSDTCGPLHITPDRWVRRNGAAYCPKCDRFMGHAGSEA